MSTPPSTPPSKPKTQTKSYSLRPAWLTESHKALDKFRKTSEAVKQEFLHLSDAFVSFEAAAESAKQVDQKHIENLKNGFTSNIPSLEERRATMLAEAQKHTFVRLPTELHGKIVLFLEFWDIDALLALSGTVRKALCTFPEVWKPWATQRWDISNAEGEKDWLMACSIKASVLRPTLLLIEKYRHRDAASYKSAGTGQLDEWSELLGGLVYLTSSPGDWMSRRMLRRAGGVRILIGLAEHDSRKIRTLALASLANSMACSRTTEQERWLRNLQGYRAAKIFSSIMVSPLTDVTSNSSREAARALVNLSLPHYASISYEKEVLARSNSHWRGGDAKWENDGSWQLDLTYQSGGTVGWKLDNVVLRFEMGGILIGSMFDYSNDMREGRILWCRGWYDFQKDLEGMGQISFSIYKSEEDARLAVVGLLSDGLISNEFLGGVGAIRNFTGYCTSQSRGFFGIWENSLHQRESGIKLSGGGGFRLRWKRTTPTSSPTNVKK